MRSEMPYSSPKAVTPRLAPRTIPAKRRVVRRGIFHTLVLTILVPTLVAAAQREKAETVSIRERAVRAFERSAPEEWRFRFDDATGELQTIFGSRSRPLDIGSRSKEAAIREFLFDHHELFGMRRGHDELRAVRQLTQKGVTFVRYQQVHRDVPVEGGEFNVALDAQACVRMIAGHGVPDLDLSVMTRMPASVAGRAAVSAMTSLGATKAEKSELVIYTQIGSPRLAWRVRVTGTRPGEDWTTWVDATSGDLLEHQSNVRFYNGLANVFNQDPRDPLDEVGLTSLSGPTALSDDDIVVQNLSGSDVVGSNGDFRYQPADSIPFAQAHAYFHAHRLLSWLASLGYSGPSTTLTLKVNDPNPISGAAAYAIGSTMYFSRKKNNSPNTAYDAQIVYHEVMHTLTNQLSGLGTGLEAARLHEGLSEYMASSLTWDPMVQDWFYDFPSCSYQYPPRSVHNSPSYFNTSNISNIWPCYWNTGSPGPHQGGLIVAGGLWDLREQLGQERVDQLVLEALPFIPTNANMACFMDAVFQAECLYHDCEAMLAIVTVEAQRGLTCVPTTSLAGPSPAYVGVENQYFVAWQGFNCGLVPLAYTDWYKRPLSGGSWTLIEEGGAQTLAITFTDTADVQLRASTFDAFGRQSTKYIDVPVYSSKMEVLVTGPSVLEMGGCAPGTWSASVSGGTAPRSYQWQINGEDRPNQTNPTYTTGWNEPFYVSCVVTDAEGQRAEGGKSVGVTGECPPLVRGDLDLRPLSPRDRSEARAIVSLGQRASVRLDVYDILGRRVQTAFEGSLEPGSHTIGWNTSGLAGGIYHYRLLGIGKSISKRFIVLR